MTTTVDMRTIPSDPEQLRRLVRDLLLQNQVLQELLSTKERDLEKLRHQLQQLLRRTYGKSAETPQAQILLDFMMQMGFLEAEKNQEDAQAAAEEKPRGNGHHRHGRRPLPDNLPVERREYEVPESERHCPECGSELEKIGEETSEQLEHIPSHFLKVVHARFKYACKCCQGYVVTAGKPPQPIEKGLPGPGLLAWIIVSKYGDHLPLHRLEQIFRRNGVDLNRSTLCDWVKQVIPILTDVYEAMCREVMLSKVLHTDDTVTPVLDPSRDRTRQGRMWVYVGDQDHPHTVFTYTPDRSREGPLAFLAGYQGQYLQADAYSGYDALYQGGQVKEVACWAHARRKFFDAQGSDSVRALTALVYIKRLYKVEHKAADLSPEARCAMRQERSRPILKEFRDWLLAQFNPIQPGVAPVLPKSPMGEAISYALNNWAALCRYTDDGILAIDNNVAERALRPVCVGRKNWLHIGSDNGGNWAAVLFTLIESCKRAGKEPYAYLKDILTRVRSHPKDRIQELFPANWTQAQA